MVTLSDIAKMANVSKSTVSRYLNKGSVSEKTRQKLEKIIEETNYQPNLLAQSLKAQKSSMVGVIIPRYDSPSTNQVLKGIDAIAHEHDIQLMTMNSNLDSERTKKNIRILQRQKVGVIILLATTIDSKLRQMIINSQTPVLVVGQQVNGNPSFIYQDYQAGQTVAKHAIELGHQKLLFVGVSEEDYAVGVLRKKGFYDLANKNQRVTKFIETEFSRSETYHRALKFLPQTQATYIAAATDHIAIGIYNACVELGIKVPNDLSLSGFGGYSETKNVIPHITTVTYPFYEMGERVMNAALDAINSERVELLTEMPVKLKVQGSTHQLER